MDETNELPDPSEAWTAAQRVTAGKLAQKYHETWQQVAPRYQPTHPVEWEELPEVIRTMMTAVFQELLFGDQGGELVGTTGFPG